MELPLIYKTYEEKFFIDLPDLHFEDDTPSLFITQVVNFNLYSHLTLSMVIHAITFIDSKFFLNDDAINKLLHDNGISDVNEPLAIPHVNFVTELIDTLNNKMILESNFISVMYDAFYIGFKEDDIYDENESIIDGMLTLIKKVINPNSHGYINGLFDLLSDSKRSPSLILIVYNFIRK